MTKLKKKEAGNGPFLNSQPFLKAHSFKLKILLNYFGSLNLCSIQFQLFFFDDILALLCLVHLSFRLFFLSPTISFPFWRLGWETSGRMLEVSRESRPKSSHQLSISFSIYFLNIPSPFLLSSSLSLYIYFSLSLPITLVVSFSLKHFLSLS